MEELSKMLNWDRVATKTAFGLDASVKSTFTTTTTTAMGIYDPTATSMWLEYYPTSIVVVPPTCENLENVYGTPGWYEMEHDASSPNPDIAGLGTIMAFILTSFSALTVTLVAYYGGFLSGNVLSRADRQAFFANSRNVSSEWRRVLDSVALSLSDQQLVTGLAILIAGYAGFNDMDVYHWNIIVCLAWMSSAVHITSLSLLRDVFDSNPRLRNLRVFGMLVLLVLLTGAFWPLRWDESATPYWVPVRCIWSQWFSKEFWGDGPPDISNEWELTLGLLFAAYIWKLCQLFAPSRSLARKWLRAKPEAAIERLLRRLAKKNNDVWPRRAYKALAIFHMVFAACSEFADSFMASACYFCVSLPWGTARLLYWRSTVSKEVRAAETRMTFGQLVPIFLLVLPLLLVFELASGPAPKNKEHNAIYSLIAEERYRASRTIYPNLSSALLTNEPSQWDNKMNLDADGVPDPVIDHLLSTKAFKMVVWALPVSILIVSLPIAISTYQDSLIRLAILEYGGLPAIVFFIPAVAAGAFYFSKRLR